MSLWCAGTFCLLFVQVIDAGGGLVHGYHAAGLPVWNPYCCTCTGRFVVNGRFTATTDAAACKRCYRTARQPMAAANGSAASTPAPRLCLRGHP